MVALKNKMTPFSNSARLHLTLKNIILPSKFHINLTPFPWGTQIGQGENWIVPLCFTHSVYRKMAALSRTFEILFRKQFIKILANSARFSKSSIKITAVFCTDTLYSGEIPVRNVDKTTKFRINLA